jgi:WD40 repeat protein
LLVIDLKKNRVAVAPESFEDEILCMAVTSNGDQVACGTALGNVNIFRYNYWGKFQNRLPQHPSQINCLAIDPSDDANLFTGCTDGTVRRISLRNPKKALELVQLDDSIETLSILQSGPGKPWGLVVATCTDGLLHLIPNPTNGADDNEVKIVREKSKSKIPESNGKTAANRQFFADME